MSYYLLKPEYSLRGWQKLPRAVVREGTGSPVFIPEEIFDVLSLCNGKCDFSLSLITDRQRSIAEQLAREGTVEKLDRPRPWNKEQEYRLYPARYIRTAHWSVTGKCNYRCKHCYMSAADAKLGELPLDTVLRITDDLARCGVRTVSLTGGEPLVRGDFWQIVDALLERKIIIEQIYSNGSLVNDAFLDGLERRGLKNCVINMSFDGVGWHDWLRGVPGAEKKVNDAFIRCRDRGFRTASEMCIHEKNKHSLRESVNHLAEVGCRSLKTNPVSDLGAWKENGYGVSIGIRELFETYLEYIPRFYEDGAPLSIQLGGFFAARKGDTETYRLPFDRQGGDPEKVCLCDHARNVMYISPEGRALPCFALSGMSIQNRYPVIQEIGLENCLTRSSYMELIQTRAARVIEHNERCGACEFRNACMGGCRASALETDPEDVLGIDPACCEYYRGGWSARVRAAAEAAIRRTAGGR